MRSLETARVVRIVDEPAGLHRGPPAGATFRCFQASWASNAPIRMTL